MEKYQLLISRINNHIARLQEESANYRECTVDVCRYIETEAWELKQQLDQPNLLSGKEISFIYKQVLPLLYRHSIYYTCLYKIKQNATNPDKTVEIRYYKSWKRRFLLYFENNALFYHYWKTNAGYLDSYLFNGEGQKENIFEVRPPFLIPGGPPFNPYSYTIGKFMAYEDLILFLSETQKELKSRQQESGAFRSDTGNLLTWTDSKTDLIELAYAFHAHRSINKGKAHVKQIIEALESVFRIDLGNFYRVAQGQRIRRQRTAYLDELKRSLEKWMDDSDLAGSL